MKIVDIEDMPAFNPIVKDNIDSVSAGLVVLKDGTPHCVKHGAMNKVSADGIWRCIGTYRIWLFPNGKAMDKESNACGVGCYQVRESSTC